MPRCRKCLGVMFSGISVISVPALTNLLLWIYWPVTANKELYDFVHAVFPFLFIGYAALTLFMLCAGIYFSKTCVDPHHQA